MLVDDYGRGRLPVQGADKRLKCIISHSLSAQRFPVLNRRIPLLCIFRLCGSPVSWVRYFVASVLELLAPNGLQQVP
jgi:hypothetical protein